MLPSGSGGAKGVFVVVAGDAPAVIDCLKDVCTVIVVGVPHAGDFAALGAVKPAVIVGEVRRLVKAFGVGVPLTSSGLPKGLVRT